MSRRYVIITPCRDEAEFARVTLESITRQTVPPALWVIVDDGSTDATPKILEEYAQKFPYIRIIRRLDRDPTHLHKWPRQRWLDWAARHFSVVEWSGIVRYLLPGGYYLHLVTRLFRRHAPAIIVIARKR